MTVVSTRAVAATVATLTVRVRRSIGDGSAISGNQRWSDDDIRSAIDDQLREMWVEASGQDPSGALLSGTMTYTADAETVAIPTSVDPAGYGIQGNQLYRVEDYTTPAAPSALEYIDPLTAANFDDLEGWFLAGTSIGLRPIPETAKVLRIWWLANPILIGTTTAPTQDQHPFGVQHEELITLGAAIRLQEIDEEPIGLTRQKRYDRLMERYTASCARYRGPTYVRSVRNVIV